MTKTTENFDPTTLPEPSRKLPILFVDDELGIAEAYRTFFQTRYVMHTAETVPQALAILESQDIAIVITDMRMPGQDGSDFLRIANEAFRKPIKIVLSAFVDEFFDDEFQTRYRPFAVVRKPLTTPFDLMRSLYEAEKEYEFRYNPRSSASMTKGFISANEVLQRLGISKPTLYKYLKAGLPSKRVGGRRLFDWNEILGWVKTQGHDLKA